MLSSGHVCRQDPGALQILSHQRKSKLCQVRQGKKEVNTFEILSKQIVPIIFPLTKTNK